MTKRFLKFLAVLLAILAADKTLGEEPGLFNPYERSKNGPPLTNVFHKVRSPSWFLAKIGNPMSHPAARMPDLKLTEDEVLDIVAYLKSIADPDFPEQKWPAWADKDFEEMDDDELDAMFELVDRGKAVWGNARCTICHRVNGPGGELVGGFVDLRVGGIDLMSAGTKLKRDWLYQWIKEPKTYFPDTLMPRFRLSEDDLKALVEFILRDDPFIGPEEEETEREDPSRWKGRGPKVLDEPERITRGQQLIEMSRCVVCHDIKGIAEVLSPIQRQPPPAVDTFEYLAYDLRCLSCHAIEGRGGTYAPDLSTVGSRLQEDWIAKFVESPDLVRPLSQQMPKFNLNAEEARIIATYMSSSRRAREAGPSGFAAQIPESIPGSEVTAEEVERGRKIFQAKGCFSCHTAGDGPGGVVGPDLRELGNRMHPGAVWFHLKNPHEVNPYSAEPDYGLADDQVRALAAYLSTRKQ